MGPANWGLGAIDGVIVPPGIFMKHIFTGCFLRPDIKRFCLTFTIGPDRIWFLFDSGIGFFFLQ